MEVHCDGCAGCCMDWTALLERDGDGSENGTELECSTDADSGSSEAGLSESSPRGRVGNSDAGATSRPPFDSDANFVPLTREEVRTLLERGLAAAMTPRFWHARDESEAVEIDGHAVAAIADRPVFFVGLRKPPKPVTPFGRTEPTWLPACVFLDPTTLQCRIHDEEHFPTECGAYPAHNLELDQETECERVEAAFGGDRLVDDRVTDDEIADEPLLGLQAIGEKLFCHPQPTELEGVIDRLEAGTLRPADRAECLAVASASSSGTLAVSESHYEQGKARALEAMDGDTGNDSDDGHDDDTDGDAAAGESETRSWVGPAIREWTRRYRHHQQSTPGDATPPAELAVDIEEARGAPETPGWDALE
ncbi:YkgJ family cysteine cluster protein [Natrialba sp. PRR66]|uniref:YkgJ family cysteine cluster protein n=1 Tax=Natrialba sp. PRR66 TaxID=3098146 RepID=UPI002B1D9953|nr:YkgJ family cysteine cluster protein [Natrialba sp. PRR66]